MERPLEGIRVLDLSRVLAGPYCTMTLGDLGADVIKVEQPGSGDDTRRWGPPWAGTESAYYLCVNRNKRSITLDLKSPEGKEILTELAKTADIVVENFKVGALDRMGLGYHDLSKANPRLIWCSITGYGQDGPYANRAGYDFVAQGEAGIMSITGEINGEPMKVGVAIVDITTGLFSSNAILAALHARHATGKGQHIDSSLFTSAIAWLANVGSSYLTTGELPKRLGNAHPSIVPYQTFKAKDLWIIIGAGNDRQFAALCRILDMAHLIEDPRFKDNPSRVENREELIPILNSVLETRNADEWLEEISAAGIPCGPINTLDRVFDHPQAKHRNMVVEIEHPTAGTVKLAGIPFMMSETPPAVLRHPPLLGEHTDELLGEDLGYDITRIGELRERGVIS
jgi:formyl-CoA transferase